MSLEEFGTETIKEKFRRQKKSLMGELDKTSNEIKRFDSLCFCSHEQLDKLESLIYEHRRIVGELKEHGSKDGLR